jgi:hypothetical protein
MNTVTDTELTVDGMKLSSDGGRVLLIACGALAREILAVIKLNNWTHIDLRCLPAILHNHPERITPGVEELILKHQRDYETIYVAYADCGTQGNLVDLCQKHGVQMIAGPHCYSFYDDEITAFYLTDFLVRQFDAFVWKPLGLDRHPQLRDMYFGNYEKLVYQAQTNDAALDEKAAECAERLGLAFERRFTGYGDLATSLENLT